MTLDLAWHRRIDLFVTRASDGGVLSETTLTDPASGEQLDVWTDGTSVPRARSRRPLDAVCVTGRVCQAHRRDLGDIAEEIVYRALLLRALEGYVDRWLALILQSVVFEGVHVFTAITLAWYLARLTP